MSDNTKKLLEDLEHTLVVPKSVYDLSGLEDRSVELVIIDVVKGFTTLGVLADPDSMDSMVEEIDSLAVRLMRVLGGRLHITMFRDRHDSEVPEPPYPPHCCMDTTEWTFDDRIAWLSSLGSMTTVIDKDCINGFVGSFDVSSDDRGNYDIPYRNRFLQHMLIRKPKAVIVVGDCTDICVSDFVVSLLSARNHGLLTSACKRFQKEVYVEQITGLDICVYESGCATFNTRWHPGEIAQHIGLWTMASRGAMILSGIKC